jgi:hypothetical protein
MVPPGPGNRRKILAGQLHKKCDRLYERTKDATPAEYKMLLTEESERALRRMAELKQKL